MIYLIILVILFISGTFYPNFLKVKQIEYSLETKYIEEAKQIALFEPEFTYETNDQFILAMRNCINFINLGLHKYERIPTELIIAQAVLESNYGKSRFAKQGNNLFGIRTWNKNEAQMKPKDNPDAEWGVKTYITKCKSIADMISILNRLKVYNPFRIERQRQLEEGIVDLDRMINLLSAWSTNPKYTALVKEKAKQSAELFSKN